MRREGHAPVVFERTDGVGGTWVYEADADASASPEPLVTQRRSNLDASLRTNLPRECMGFLDFPFVAGPDGDTRRFPGHAEVLRYLQSFARRFDLDGLVRLETEVVRVSRETSGTSWRVRYSRKASGSEKRETDEEVFDAVVICNGHYSQPHFADVAGNTLIHSHSRPARTPPIAQRVADRARDSLLWCRRRGCLAWEAAAQHQLPCARAIPRPSASVLPCVFGE
uniref:Flavin-containing monooxygenase n=1 Tax=Aegilops tauschii subsp. strangulata TaxID=200361 RepID=A0A453NIL5_AEGTS